MDVMSPLTQPFRLLGGLFTPSPQPDDKPAPPRPAPPAVGVGIWSAFGPTPTVGGAAQDQMPWDDVQPMEHLVILQADDVERPQGGG
jgi:hypothetical protein